MIGRHELSQIGASNKWSRTYRETSPSKRCPAIQRFVPHSKVSQVPHWGHNSRVACHPGVLWTIFLLQQHFWWPFMVADTSKYVSACSICTRNKSSSTSCQLASSSSSSWFLDVNFATRFPPSEASFCPRDCKPSGTACF